MPIRRRITIDEIDDSVDRHSITSFPAQPAKHLLSGAETGTSIDSPEPTDEEMFDRDSPYDNKTTKPIIGRTIADLIVEFKNDYRAMTVFLTIIPFIIFVTKIDSIESLKYPLILACILIFIWFVTPALVTFSRRLKIKI